MPTKNIDLSKNPSLDVITKDNVAETFNHPDGILFEVDSSGTLLVFTLSSFSIGASKVWPIAAFAPGEWKMVKYAD